MAKYKTGDTIRITESYKQNNFWILKQEFIIYGLSDYGYNCYGAKVYNEPSGELIEGELLLALISELEAHSELVKSEIDPELQKILDSGDAWAVYEYAYIARKRIPEIEKMIIDSGEVCAAYYYAKDVAKERVLEIERMIIGSNKTQFAYFYAKDVVKERVPEIEQMIIDLGDVWSAYFYAKNVAKERVPKFEKLILDSNDDWPICGYMKNVVGMSQQQAKDYSKTMSIDEYLEKDKHSIRLQEILDSGDARVAYDYIRAVAKERVPELEKMLIDSGDVWLVYFYTRTMVKERVPELEKMIIDSDDSMYIYLYVRDVVGTSYEQAEDYSHNYSKTMSIDEYLEREHCYTDKADKTNEYLESDSLAAHPELQEIIDLGDSKRAYRYVRDHIKERVLEVEQMIRALDDRYTMYLYLTDVVCVDHTQALDYAKNYMKYFSVEQGMKKINKELKELLNG